MEGFNKWAVIYAGAFLGAFFVVHFALVGTAPVIPAVGEAAIIKAAQEEAKSLPKKLIWRKSEEDIPWAKRDSHSAYLFNDKLWLLGGLNVETYNEDGKPRYDLGTYFNDIWSTDDGESWVLERAEAEFPPLRSAPVVFYKDVLYLLGGWSPEEGYKVGIWRSTDGLNWEKLSVNPPWMAREGHQVLVHEGKLWLIGGVNYDEEKAFNDIWVSEDAVNWELAVASAPWSPRWDYGLISYNGKIYVAGGMDIGDVGFDDVWASEDGLNWELVLENAPWGKRQGQVLVAYKNLLWLVGGLDAETNNGVGDAWFSGDARVWEKTAEDGAWLGREDHTATVYQDRIWVLGGMNTDWGWDNEVWYSEIGL